MGHNWKHIFAKAEQAIIEQGIQPSDMAMAWKGGYCDGYRTGHLEGKKEGDGGKTIRDLQREVHAIACDKGWWDGQPRRSPLESLALIHSEVSEAVEAYRSAARSISLPEFSNVEEELADIVIRVLDFATAEGHRLDEAIRAKIEFNKTRPHRHGGKRW